MKTKIVVIILPQRGTLLGFKQQGKTRVDTLSLGLGSAEGKKGKNAVKRQKKREKRTDRSSLFFSPFSLTTEPGPTLADTHLAGC